MLDLQHFVGAVLNGIGDGVAVSRPQHKRLQD